MASEIELKLDIRPGQLSRLKAQPWLTKLASGPAESHRLQSVYFDTEDRSLRDQRAVLRVRNDGAGYVQTFKTHGQGKQSALGRLEWKCPVERAEPELKNARKKKTGGVNLRKLAGDLKSVFETDVRRLTMPLQFHGSETELAGPR